MPWWKAKEPVAFYERFPEKKTKKVAVKRRQLFQTLERETRLERSETQWSINAEIGSFKTNYESFSFNSMKRLLEAHFKGND